ncbi:MAG: DUF2142 domain-containing protein, partial [Acetobacteraceae bacterium]|nr:DUF2142 domain-containing protein [Acetobacteraceae bacterium]
LGGRALHVASGRTIDPTPLRDSLAALSTPLEPERTEFANFSNTAFYSPADYVAQSAAIVVGRAAGLGPLGLLYAARVANGLTATLVVALAVYLLPAGGAMLAVFALLPMTVFMFASASADAPMTAAALLFTALGFRAGARGSFTGGELVAAAMAGIVFCSLKPVYAPLLLIGLPGVLRSADRKRFLFAHAAILTACIGVAGLWLHFGSSIMVPTLPWVSVPAQTEWIMAHKLVFIWVILHTVRLFATDWAREIVGKLGWHNLWVPQYTYVFPLAAAALGLTLPRPRPLRLSLLEFGWLAFLVASSVFLLLTALYLTWTGVGNGFVGGGQGRYFMPYLGILAIIVEGALPMLDRWKARIAAGGIVAIMLAQAILTCNLVAQAWHVL